MKLIRQLLDEKGRSVWSIRPEATVYEAIDEMARHNVGALLVLDAGRLAGIVSERDYTRKVILEGRSSRDTAVREIMTDNVVCGKEHQRVDECMALMTDKRIRHLPIVDEGDELVGMVSIGDLVKTIISEQQYLIAQLEHYIQG